MWEVREWYDYGMGQQGDYVLFYTDTKRRAEIMCDMLLEEGLIKPNPIIQEVNIIDSVGKMADYFMSKRK